MRFQALLFQEVRFQEVRFQEQRPQEPQGQNWRILARLVHRRQAGRARPTAWRLIHPSRQRPLPARWQAPQRRRENWLKDWLKGWLQALRLPAGPASGRPCRLASRGMGTRRIAVRSPPARHPPHTQPGHQPPAAPPAPMSRAQISSHRKQSARREGAPGLRMLNRASFQAPKRRPLLLESPWPPYRPPRPAVRSPRPSTPAGAHRQSRIVRPQETIRQLSFRRSETALAPPPRKAVPGSRRHAGQAGGAHKKSGPTSTPGRIWFLPDSAGPAEHRRAIARIAILFPRLGPRSHTHARRWRQARQSKIRSY